MFKFLVFCTLLILVQGDEKVLTGDYELQYVHVMIRCAEHSPSKEYLSLSPFLNLAIEDFAPYGECELYTHGERRMFENGVDLRNRYKDFFANNPKVDLLSYDFEAAKHGILFTQAGLNGLEFKQVKEKVFTPKQLAGTHNKKLIKELISALDHINCSRFDEEMDGFDPIDKAILKKYWNKLKDVNEKTGPLPFAESYFILYETYRMYNESGKPLPEWFTKSQRSLKALALDALLAETATTTLKKFGGGLYASHVLDEVKNIKRGKSEKKIVLFGSTPFLLTFVGTLGGVNGYNDETIGAYKKYPTFAAMFNIEVYKKLKDGTYHFRLLYRNARKHGYEKLVLKDCEDLCEFKKYKKLLRPVLIERGTLQEECDKARGAASPNKQ